MFQVVSECGFGKCTKFRSQPRVVCGEHFSKEACCFPVVREQKLPFVGVQFRCDRLLFVPLCDRLQHIPTTPKCCMQGLYQCRLRLGGTVQGGGRGGGKESTKV